MTAINRPAENIHVIYLHFVEELFFVFIKGLQFFCFKYCSQYFIIVRARSLPSFYPGHQRPTCPQYLLPPQGLPVAPLWKGPTSPPFSNARTTGAPALGTMIGLKKKKNHARAYRLCRAHASSACLCVSWPGWGAMGFQLPGGDSPEPPSDSWPARVHHEACNSRLEKRRAKLGSWSLASERCVHAWKLQAGLAISLSKMLVLCRLCKSGTNVHTLCGGTQALSPFSFTNPHLTAYERLGIPFHEWVEWAVEGKWLYVKILDLSHHVKSGALPRVTQTGRRWRPSSQY